MMRRVSRSAALACCACCAYCACCACSAMGLGEADHAPCVPRETCVELNTDISADECFVYECSDRGPFCELQPRDEDRDHSPDALSCSDQLEGELDCDDNDPDRGGETTETCDGQDNDCDGWIDEDARFSKGQADSNVLSLGLPSRTGYGELHGQELHGALIFDDATRGFTFSGSGLDLADGEALVDESCDDGFCCGGERCNFSEVALGGSGANTIGAAVHRGESCQHGQLHVGLRKAEQRALVLDLGIEVRAAGRFGCTQRDPEFYGAQKPAIATSSSGAEVARGLVTFLAKTGQGDACEAVDAAVLGVGLEVPSDGELRLQNNEPLFLGCSAREIATSVLPISKDGASAYLVAFPERRGIRLKLIPPGALAQTALDPEIPGGSSIRADVEHVAVAGDRETGAGLAVAWRDPEGVLRLSPIEVDLGAHEITPAESPLVLYESDRIVAGPVASYARAGFAAIDAARADTAGGWLVAWIEHGSDRRGGRMLAVRIAEAGTDLLGEPFVLAEGALSDPFVATRSSTADGDQHRFVYGFVGIAGQENPALEIAALDCDPST